MEELSENKKSAVLALMRSARVKENDERDILLAISFLKLELQQIKNRELTAELDELNRRNADMRTYLQTPIYEEQ